MHKTLELILKKNYLLQVGFVKKFRFFLGHGLRKIDWELNHKKYIRINFNAYFECQ